MNKSLYFCLCYVLLSGTTRDSMIETCVFDRLLDSIANFENMHNDCPFVFFGI